MARPGDIRPRGRAEGKARTRQALLDAAMRLLPVEGYAGLSASAVSREAGVAQPTFYVHFRDKEDLVRALLGGLASDMRRGLSETRARFVASGNFADLRDGFRVPFELWSARPGLLAVWTREMRNPSSPIGEVFRGIQEDAITDLVRDLEALWKARGVKRAEADTRMMAQMLVALTEAMGVAHLEGRFPDGEAVIDMLARAGEAILQLPAGR